MFHPHARKVRCHKCGFIERQEIVNERNLGLEMRHILRIGPGLYRTARKFLRFPLVSAGIHGHFPIAGLF